MKCAICLKREAFVVTSTRLFGVNSFCKKCFTFIEKNEDNPKYGYMGALPTLCDIRKILRKRDESNTTTIS